MKGGTVTIGAKQYNLQPPGREEWNLLDKYVLKNRRSTLKLAKDNLDGLSPELQQSLLRDALQIEASRSVSKPTALEYGAVLDTREGCAYLIWLAMRRDHPDMTLERVEELIQQQTDEEFERLLEERDSLEEGDQDGRGEPGGGEPAADEAGG